jgi:glutathione S-transferase
MLKLYKAGNSICTQKVLMTLDEKGLTFDTHNINLFKNEQYDPEYLKLNPKGVVPTLDHDGKIIIESTLICEYLDALFPEPRLVPEDPYLRAQMSLWSKAIDEGIFEATRELSFSAMFREKMKNMSEEQRQKRFRNVGDPERRARYISTYEEGIESHYVFEAIANYEKLFKNMAKALEGGNDWLLGDKFSMADIALAPYVARVHYLNLLDVWIEERPAIRDWFTRIQARPSYAVAVSDPFGEDEEIEMRKYGSLNQPMVREKRAEYLANY